MTDFILSIDRETGRAILDCESHGPVIGSIQANAITAMVKNSDGVMEEKIIKSAWRIAREKVDESKFYQVQNVGWFAIDDEVAA